MLLGITTLGGLWMMSLVNWKLQTCCREDTESHGDQCQLAGCRSFGVCYTGLTSAVTSGMSSQREIHNRAGQV